MLERHGPCFDRSADIAEFSSQIGVFASAVSYNKQLISHSRVATSFSQNMASCPNCGANPIGADRVTYPCDNSQYDRGRLIITCSDVACKQGRYYAPALRRWETCRACNSIWQRTWTESAIDAMGQVLLKGLAPCA
jgi:hypothetical protein